MSIGNAESSINGHLWDGFDVYNDGEANDNLIKNPKIRESATYLADIEEAEQLFLASLEGKDEATKANLSILHSEVVKNSLNIHLDTIITEIVSERVSEHDLDARKFSSHVWRRRIWENEEWEDVYEKTYSLRLIVEWGWIFNDPKINEIGSIFKTADESWIDLGRTLEDIAGEMNEHLYMAKSNIEENRDTVMNDNLDFVLANWDLYKDHIDFGSRWNARWYGKTAWSIRENEATAPMLVNLNTAGVNIWEFVAKVKAAREIEDGNIRQQDRQNERDEHLQVASIYENAMNNDGDSTTQLALVDDLDGLDEDEDDDDVLIASADETISVVNPEVQQMKDLVEGVDFSSNKYNDIYTNNPELVEAIQMMLEEEQTGLYDPETFEAVKVFQTENNSTVDGLAGPNTLAIMIEKKIPAVITANPSNQYASNSNWMTWSL